MAAPANRCVLMRLVDRLDRLETLGDLARLLLAGGAAVVIGIFLALLTSTCDAHAAGPVHTRHSAGHVTSLHVSSYGSKAAPDATDLDASAAANRGTAYHHSRHERAGQASLDPAPGRAIASTAQTTSTGALARDRVPRARPAHHPRAQTSEPLAAVPQAHAPPAPDRPHSPAPSDDDPSGPLPTQESLVLQSSPLATTFSPGVPFAFFGLLALLLGRRAVREHASQRTLRGMTFTVPWPPG